MTKTDTVVKVPLRAATMRIAGEWMRDTLARSPHLKKKIHPDFLSFLVGLEARGRRKGRETRKVELPREFAETLAAAGQALLAEHEPVLLLHFEPNPGGPVPTIRSGLEAMAEIINTVALISQRPPGRPSAVDPLEAYDRNEAQKRAVPKGKRANMTSAERAAKDLRVSPRAIDAVLPIARGVVKAMKPMKPGEEKLRIWFAPRNKK